MGFARFAWLGYGCHREAENGADSRRVDLDQPIPVLIVYGTAVVREGGEVYFFDDIYGYDAAFENYWIMGIPTRVGSLPAPDASAVAQITDAEVARSLPNTWRATQPPRRRFPAGGGLRRACHASRPRSNSRPTRPLRSGSALWE